MAAHFLPVVADSTIEPEAKAPLPVLKTDPKPAPEKPAQVYGIPIEGLQVHQGTVGKGQTLATLLGDRGLCGSRILAAVQAGEGIFDPRLMKAGQPYAVFTDADGVPVHFVYESSATDYVVFDLGDPAKVHSVCRPVETRLATVTAEASQGLWNSLEGQGVDAGLIASLQEVFGQTVDFFALEPEDRLTLVFEENYVEGRKVGCGRILAARMLHKGETYNSFYFEDGRRCGYYDEKGRSVRGRFLRAPLQYNRISSGFSLRRLHPILNVYRPHLAIDYAAPAGTPVMAVGDGKVLRTGFDKNAGRFIRLDHGNRCESRYIHLSRLAKGIRAGKRVQRGEVIGYVGQTGLATGPHLDFAFYRNGTAVNFRQMKPQRAEPVGRTAQGLFGREVVEMGRYLDASEPTVVAGKPKAVEGSES